MLLELHCCIFQSTDHLCSFSFHSFEENQLKNIRLTAIPFAVDTHLTNILDGTDLEYIHEKTQ